MWIFTETGFVSAIADARDPKMIVVRSRERESLDGIAALADVAIQSTPLRDYPFRVHVPRAVLKQLLSTQVDDLDYTNFKNRVHDVRGESFHDALTAVWEIMHHVQEQDETS